MTFNQNSAAHEETAESQTQDKDSHKSLYSKSNAISEWVNLKVGGMRHE